MVLSVLDDLNRGNYSQINKFSKPALRQIKDGFNSIKKEGIGKKTLYSFSKKHLVAAIDDVKGIKDMELKYLGLPLGVRSLVQYSRIYDQTGKIRGYRYYNVGRHPLKTSVSILGLKEFLSIIEILFQSKQTEITRERIWASHSRPDVVITGPSCSDYTKCSVIEPEILINLVEIFLEYFENNKIKYKNINCANILSPGLQKKLKKLLFSNRVLCLVRRNIKHARDLMQDLARFKELESMIICVSERREKTYLRIGPDDIRFEPISVFLNPDKFKRKSWDFSPRGYSYWLPYYGDPESVKQVKKLLAENSDGVSPKQMVGWYQAEFYRRKFSLYEKIKNRGQGLKALKEAIRILKIIDNKKQVNKCFNILEDFSKNKKTKEIAYSVSAIWGAINNISQEKVIKTISKNVDKMICYKQ